MRTPVLRFTIPLVAASLAQAQSNPPPIPQIRFDYNDETPWPTGTTVPTSFSRALAGDFDGNGLMDAVVLEQESAGGKVVYYPQPDSWPFQSIAWQANGPLANDIDLIPASGGMPTQIAIVGANGLDRLLYAADGTYPVNGGRMGSYFAWAPVSHDALWQGAKLVRTGQLDAGGADLDYVGVKDAINQTTQQLESTVVVRQKIGANTTTISFTLPGVVVHDAFIGQWNDTPDNEIFLLNTSGVEIYTPAGVRVRRFVRPYADDGKDVFCGFTRNIVVNGAQVPEGKLHVAWFRADGTGNQALVELNAPAVTVATGVNLSDADRAVSVAPGDSPLLNAAGNAYMAADGNQELAVRHANSNSLTVYENLGPSSAYSPASFALGALQDIGTGQQLGVELNLYSTLQPMAAPLYSDLGGDGIADLFVPVHGTDIESQQRVSVVIYDGSSLIPTMSVGEPAVGGSPDIVIDYATRSTTNTFSYVPQLAEGLEFTLYLQQLSPPSGATAVEVLAWERNPSTGEYSAMNLGHGYYDYVPPGSTTSLTGMFLRVPLPSYLVGNNQSTYSGWATQCLYEVHFAQWSGSSLVTLGTNHILMFGENVNGTYSYFTDGFSDAECVGEVPTTVNSSPYNCDNDGQYITGGPYPGTQPIHSPVSFNRRRLPPLPNGNPAPLPIPPEKTRYQLVGSSIAFNGQ